MQYHKTFRGGNRNGVCQCFADKYLVVKAVQVITGTAGMTVWFFYGFGYRFFKFVNHDRF